MLNYVLVAVGSPSVLVTLSTPTLTPVTRRPIGKTGTPTCICGVHSSGVVSCTSAATTITLWQHGSGSGGSSAGGGQCVAISRDGKVCSKIIVVCNELILLLTLHICSLLVEAHLMDGYTYGVLILEHAYINGEHIIGV